MRWAGRISTVLVLLVLLAWAPLSYAQDAGDLVIQGVDDGAYPRMEISILLPPRLMPQSGVEPVFTVTENGREIEAEATSLARRRDPIDVVLLIDTSGSMDGDPMLNAKQAAEDFVGAMGADDRVALVGFSSAPDVISGFTADRGVLEQGIDSLEAAGETALHDGLSTAASLLADSEADEAYVVLLSDGGDTVSNNTMASATDALQEQGAPVYAVALQSPEYDAAALDVLAKRTNGKMLTTEDSAEITAVFAGIAEEISNAYRVEYGSLQPSTRDLEIRVTAVRGPEQAVAVSVVDNPWFDVETAALEDAVLESLSAADPLVLGIAVLLIFLTVSLFLFGLLSMFTRERAAIDQVDSYGDAASSAGAGGGRYEESSDSVRGKMIGAIGSVAEARGFSAELSRKLERAGMPLRANEYIYLHLLTTVVSGIIVQVVFGSWLISVLVIAIVTFVPIAALEVKISRRRNAFEEQLPDILSLVAGSLRAGWGIQQSIDLLVEEITEPALREFQRVQAETRLGRPLDEALYRMAERLDSDDFRWTVAAIAIQREVGGNLSEVLDVVVRTIRERGELRRHVGALTAESRFSAIILSILPFLLFVGLFWLNPGYMSVLIDSVAGIATLLVGFVLLLVGVIWLTRLTKVEV